jgi:2'-5' RNA ligase
VRLFVALELPDAWRDVAIELRATLDGVLDAESARALRWVQPDLLHLTLRFLGEFPETNLDRLRAALDRHVPPAGLDLSLAGAGRFGTPRRMQAVWLGVDGDRGGLEALAARVEQACVDAGVAPDARAFQPHITLARVRERTSPETRTRVAAAVDTLPAPEPSPFHVREVALVRSTLGNGAPRYDVLSNH